MTLTLFSSVQPKHHFLLEAFPALYPFKFKVVPLPFDAIVHLLHRTCHDHEELSIGGIN